MNPFLESFRVYKNPQKQKSPWVDFWGKLTWEVVALKGDSQLSREKTGKLHMNSACEEVVTCIKQQQVLPSSLDAICP